jgi:hypothetical protein
MKCYLQCYIYTVYTWNVWVCKADVSSVAYATYNGSLVIVTTVSMTAAKFKPIVFFVLGCTLSDVTNIPIDTFLSNIRLLLVCFWDEVVRIRHFQRHMKISG